MVEAAPKISVIIPAYNAARWIAKAIHGAASQTVKPFEIIVIDDGSTDNTPEILSRYGAQIRAIRQENSGVSAARNLGMKLAVGDWLAFLDADDQWLAEKLARVMERAGRSPHVALFSHDVLVIDEQDAVVGAYRFERAGGNVARKLIMGNWVITSTAVLRADAARKTGKFREDLRKRAGSEDWDYWLRVAMKHQIEHIQEPLAFYRRISGSATRSSLDDALADSLRVVSEAGAAMGLSEWEMREAQAGVYRESAIRRLAALDSAAARRELAEVKRFSGWTAPDAAMWLASLFPANIQRSLLRMKKFRDAWGARKCIESLNVKSDKS